MAPPDVKNTLEVKFPEGFYPSENVHIMNTHKWEAGNQEKQPEVKFTCSKQNAMCGISWVFNNILTMANDLIINLKSTGTHVGFGLNVLVK